MKEDKNFIKSHRVRNLLIGFVRTNKSPKSLKRYLIEVEKTIFSKKKIYQSNFIVTLIERFQLCLSNIA